MFFNQNQASILCANFATHGSLNYVWTVGISPNSIIHFMGKKISRFELAFFKMLNYICESKFYL